MKKTVFRSAILMASVFFIPVVATAVYNDGNGTILGVKMEVCKKAVCEESDWVTYETDGSGPQNTLLVSPGDTIKFRASSWNEGTNDVNPTYNALITNAAVFSDISAFEGVNDDVDNNGNFYSLIDGQTTGNDYAMAIDIENDLFTTSNADNPEVGELSATVRTDYDIPDQTAVDVTFNIVAADPLLAKIPLIGKAYAAGLTESKAKIIISNPDNTQPVENLPAELPRTGTNFGLIFSSMAGIFLTGAYLSARKLLVR
ncbi:hypothetical protein C4544_05810 [candidate division WS5 bacterium]|uniref:LPXTG cell wall anchor domain-containing protein n=1 Tax=candidate division WS5 bacterium TaxID=2093353 RepID=A0A419DAX5_9BACT|nr:MAG: hypothetical protein C4544_05810 [candidate division WS5 bacterium]